MPAGRELQMWAAENCPVPPVGDWFPALALERHRPSAALDVKAFGARLTTRRKPVYREAVAGVHKGPVTQDAVDHDRPPTVREPRADLHLDLRPLVPSSGIVVPSRI